MMLILSLIHSLIVSTNPGPEKQNQNSRTKRLKRRRFFVIPPSCECKRTSSEDNFTKIKTENGILKKKVQRSRKTKLVNKLEQADSSKKPMDEGFESFNGNGSSENGDETKDINKDENKVPEVKTVDNDLNEKTKNKDSTDDNESDTESDHDMIIRKRTHRVSISKPNSDTDSDTQMTYKSVVSLVSSYVLID